MFLILLNEVRSLFAYPFFGFNPLRILLLQYARSLSVSNRSGINLASEFPAGILLMVCVLDKK